MAQHLSTLQGGYAVEILRNSDFIYEVNLIIFVWQIDFIIREICKLAEAQNWKAYGEQKIESRNYHEVGKNIII